MCNWGLIVTATLDLSWTSWTRDLNPRIHLNCIVVMIKSLRLSRQCTVLASNLEDKWNRSSTIDAIFFIVALTYLKLQSTTHHTHLYALEFALQISKGISWSKNTRDLDYNPEIQHGRLVVLFSASWNDHKTTHSEIETLNSWQWLSNLMSVVLRSHNHRYPSNAYFEALKWLQHAQKWCLTFW